MPKRLAISKVRAFARENGLTQVIVAAWDGQLTHITTYGKSAEDSAQAAAAGNKIKDAFGWPKDLHTEPKRVQKLLDRIRELEAEVAGFDQQIEQIVLNPPKVHLVQMTEYERGWGSKPDGLIAFETADKARAYITEQNLEETRRNPSGKVPDMYTIYTYRGEAPCSFAFAKLLKGSKLGCIYVDYVDDLLR